jgi:hypothetical protein
MKGETMQRNTGRTGDIYYHTTAENREWVNPGQIPVFKKLFAEFDAINQRLNRLEQSLVQFANAHKLEHDGTLETVIGALCNEVQIIKSGKPYLAVHMNGDVIRKVTKPDYLLSDQVLPKYVEDTYYTVENGKVVEHVLRKEQLKEVIL